MLQRTLRTRSGFSLLELVVVLALLAILTCVIAPSATALLNSRARRATMLELDDLGRAAVEHFDDVAALPTDVDNLLAGEVAGWCGPYLAGTRDDTISGGSRYRVDAWSRPYRLTPAGDVLEIRSGGRDATMATADDLVVEVDVTPVRRRWTLDRLEVLNAAIQAWNEDNLADSPLPADFGVIHATLTSPGWLPLADVHTVGGWGDAYVPDPVGVEPATRVRSLHLDGAQEIEGSGSGGDDGGGWDDDDRYDDRGRDALRSLGNEAGGIALSSRSRPFVS